MNVCLTSFGGLLLSLSYMHGHMHGHIYVNMDIFARIN